MLVRDRMTSPAKTVTAITPFQDALNLMREGKFRRVPVVDERGSLVGIVSERDMLHAAPSPATSLSIWEVNYLLWRLKVSDVMTEDVISVTPDTPIEVAAHLMVSKKIGGLPVVDQHNCVLGVITETDIFKAFTELFAGDEHGVRIEVRVPEASGTLARLAQAIFDLGGNIRSMGTFYDTTADHRVLMIKVAGVDQDKLTARVTQLGDEILDARTV
jgi:acetoin utilization protein AcuB